MKNIIIFCLLLCNNLIYSQSQYFSFDKDTIKEGDSLTGYIFKLHNIKKQLCFKKSTNFLFKINKNSYIVPAVVVSKNKCTTQKSLMVRFSYDLESLFSKIEKKDGKYLTADVYIKSKYRYLNKMKLGKITIIPRWRERHARADKKD